MSADAGANFLLNSPASGVSPKSLHLTSVLNPKFETLCYPIQYSL